MERFSAGCLALRARILGLLALCASVGLVAPAHAVEWVPRGLGGGVSVGAIRDVPVGGAGFAVEWHNFEISTGVFGMPGCRSWTPPCEKVRLGVAAIGRWRNARLQIGAAVQNSGGVGWVNGLLLPSLRVDFGALQGNGTAGYLHVAAGSPWSRAIDLFGVGVVTRSDLGAINELGLQVGINDMFERVGPFAEVHVGFAGGAMQFLPTARLSVLKSDLRFGNSAAMATVGLAIRLGGHETFHCAAAAFPVPSADSPSTSAFAYADPPGPPVPWPDTRQILRRGRRFYLLHGPLRVAFGAAVPPPTDVTCIVDEAREADGASWYHLQCDHAPPAGAPRSWATGCYRVDRVGIWQLPFCPGDPASVALSALKPANLLVPSVAPGGSLPDAPPVSRTRTAIAIDLTYRQILATQIRVAGVTHAVTCVQEHSLGRFVHCYDNDVGLLWAAHRWDAKVETTPERGMLVVHSDDEVLPEATPRFLAFRDPGSAQCESAPACRAFGLCRAAESGCIAASDLDCRAANVCASAGLCRAKGGGCDVGDDEDCAASEACKRHGHCKASAGHCVAP